MAQTSRPSCRASSLVVLTTAALCLGVLCISCRSKKDDVVERSITKLDSPDGAYEAELKVETWAGGFGTAGVNANVKVTKRGTGGSNSGGGWFFMMPLEYRMEDREAGLPIPTIQWTEPHVLKIHVESADVSGTLVQQVGVPTFDSDGSQKLGYRIGRDDMQVVREYVQHSRSNLLATPAPSTHLLVKPRPASISNTP